jgi:uncharacterized protein (TIGR02270 family)
MLRALPSKPMTSRADPPICEDDLVWDIEDEHLREAEFLFEVREALLDSPSHSLAELEAGSEQRFIAHVDALVLGGSPVTQRLLLPTIEDEDQVADYELIAAASLAVLAQPGSDRVLAMLDRGGDAQRAGIARALQLVHNPWLERRLIEDVMSFGDLTDSRGLAARLDALAAHGVSPGPWLQRFLVSSDPSLARAAANLARFSRDRATLDLLGPLALAADADLRRTTIETALHHTLPGAWESAAYWAFCPGDSPFRRDALVWVACMGDADAHARVIALVDDPNHRADALWAAGFCGRVAAVDRCIPLLADEHVGPLAGEVVSAITGLSSTDDSFWRAPVNPDDPQDTLPPLEQDDLDADLVPESEASLRRPEPEAIADWWQAHRETFDPSLRYLGGRPLDRDALVSGLRYAPMRRRHALGFELGVRSGGAFVNTRALCAIQKRQLDALAMVGPLDCQRGLSLR